MTTSTTENPKETGRTPSMFASLLVLGVMVQIVAILGGLYVSASLMPRKTSTL